jgi:hypothetical protein
MAGMDFTELVQRKIEERREGRSAVVQAAAKADERFRTRVAPLVAAVSGMIERLSSDPMFGYAIGRPEVTVKRDDKLGQEGSLSFGGRAGRVLFIVTANGSVLVRIQPDWAVATALDCDMSYEVDPIRGDLSGIDDLLLRVCDHLGDFLADIYLSPAVHLVQPEAGKPDSLKW